MKLEDYRAQKNGSKLPDVTYCLLCLEVRKTRPKEDQGLGDLPVICGPCHDKERNFNG